MTLNDLLKQGRAITDQLTSGGIPLIDTEGKEVNLQLALRYSEDEGEPLCEIASVRRKLDDMTQEEWEELNALAHHAYLCIQDNRLCGYFAGDTLREVLSWLDEHNFEY